MPMTLEEVAQRLRDTDKTVQLIYAFNGTGKTRLSRAFKDVVAPKGEGDDASSTELADRKMLYYSAFTEDLFYWDNDLEQDAEPTLKIQPNAFTTWVLEEQGQDRSIATTFQRYTSEKLTPHFSADFSSVSFSFERGNQQPEPHIKISKGEESNFIWSIFYTLLDLVVSTLNDVQPDYPEATPFDGLEYVFIDDPVSSLDDNHLIQLAVDLAQLIKMNRSRIKFIITTHSPIFFNVLSNELGSDEKTERYSWKSKSFAKARLEKEADGSLGLIEQPNDSPFAYHLYLMAQLKQAIQSDQIEKYHFNLLRNVLEKTATFLGYKRWEHLLPTTDDGKPNTYAKRIVNFSSHSKHATEEVPSLKPEEKQLLAYLVAHVDEHYRFGQQKGA
jgi:hypothetical protein